MLGSIVKNAVKSLKFVDIRSDRCAVSCLICCVFNYKEIGLLKNMLKPKVAPFAVGMVKNSIE
jgi:hypothetical protein